MTGYPQLPPADIAWLLDQCRAALDEIAPELGASAGQLVAAHGPQQWPVEWHLPWWLATSLGLPEASWRALTVCNLLGLGYVRLQDQLGEQSDGALPAASLSVLASACYEGALARLARLFWATPLFWQHRSVFMAQWLRSLLDDDAMGFQPWAAWQEGDRLRLAWRGAPLKITAVGVCLLAQRADLIPTLVGALDHLLTAQVLLDHVDDWREDLTNGRFNAFVAFASSLTQQAMHVDENSRRVQALLMMGDPAGYFASVHRHTAQAHALAQAIGCSGLAGYIASFAVEAQAGCERLTDQARSLLANAVDRVLAA